MRSSGNKDMWFCYATPMESRFIIAAMKQKPISSSIGASGSAAYGRSKSKAQTASELVSLNDGQFSCIAANTIELGMRVLPVRCSDL